MGKGKRLRLKRKFQQQGNTEELSNRISEDFQRNLRISEIWDEMVAEFGEKRAEELLEECKAEVKPFDVDN